MRRIKESSHFIQTNFMKFSRCKSGRLNEQIAPTRSYRFVSALFVRSDSGARLDPDHTCVAAARGRCERPVRVAEPPLLVSCLRVLTSSVSPYCPPARAPRRSNMWHTRLEQNPTIISSPLALKSRLKIDLRLTSR